MHVLTFVHGINFSIAILDLADKTPVHEYFTKSILECQLHIDAYNDAT